MSKKSAPLNYDELLAKNPDQTLWRTSDYFQENTSEATEQAKKRRLVEIGHVVKFIQDHGLTRRKLCETAPEIPEGFFVYLRDITPEGLEFYRTAYMKWLKRFERNMHTDPSDVRIMEKALAEMRAKAGIAPVTVAEPARTSIQETIEPHCSEPSIPFRKYDDATWHSEGDFPADLDPNAGATHIGMFVAWLLLHDMASEDHTQAFSTKMAQLSRREISPGTYLLQVCDGSFTSEEVNKVGNAFADAYYDMQKGDYIRDYEQCLALGLPSIYHTPDSWDTYDKISPIINERFLAWKHASKMP